MLRKDQPCIDLETTTKHGAKKIDIPHQTLKSFSTLDGWKAKADKVVKNYMRRFYLASLEVIRRRDKHSAPCIAGDYDSTILGSAMRSSGCKHSIIKTNDSYPICNTENSFVKFEKE